MDRDALLKNLRGVSYDGMDRSVDVAISRLRKSFSTTRLSLIASKRYAIKAIIRPARVGQLIYGSGYEKAVCAVLPPAVRLFLVMTMMVGLVYKFTASEQAASRWMI